MKKHKGWVDKHGNPKSTVIQYLTYENPDKVKPLTMEEIVHLQTDIVATSYDETYLNKRGFRLKGKTKKERKIRHPRLNLPLDEDGNIIGCAIKCV